MLILKKKCWHNTECLSACVSERSAIKRELYRHSWKVRAYGISLLTGLFLCTESNEFGQSAQHLRKQGTAKRKHCTNVFHLNSISQQFFIN